MIETITMLFIGLVIGFALKKFRVKDVGRKLDKMLSIIVMFLLFVMGLKLGSDDKIIYNLMFLGYHSIILAFLIFLGSIIFGYLFNRVRVIY